MMKKVGIYFLTAILLCQMVYLISGCSESMENNQQVQTEIQTEQVTPPTTQQAEPQEKVQLALKFIEGQTSTYKVIIESRRQAEWEGTPESKPVEFTGGETFNKIEMTYNRYIQGIEENGNAIARITITEIKYTEVVQDKTVLDFDSSREDNQHNALSSLIGQSYTIEITPTGSVAQIIDVSSAQAAVLSAPNNTRALNLLTEDNIKNRHTIKALASAENKELAVGESWNVQAAYSFDEMGSKTYEKIYTLDSIENSNGNKVASVSLEAIPSEQSGQLAAFPFPYDNLEEYTGSLLMDLTGGDVLSCSEKLLTEWTFIDSAAAEDERPDAVKVSATQLFSLEKME